MEALEKLWDGMSPCMEPGVGDCVVWWDAWAVVAAFIAVAITLCALAVAVSSVVATVLSGGAVVWLGFQANKLAFAGQKNEGRREEAMAAQISREREREESVVFCFVYPEVNDLELSLGAIVEGFQDGHYTEEDILTSVNKRNELVECGRWMRTERLTQCFGRFHQLTDDHGLRLARLLSLVEYIRIELASLADQVSPREMANPNMAKTQETWMRRKFANITGAAVDGLKDATFCVERSEEEIRKIG